MHKNTKRLVLLTLTFQLLVLGITTYALYGRRQNEDMVAELNSEVQEAKERMEKLEIENATLRAKVSSPPPRTYCTLSMVGCNYE